MTDGPAADLSRVTKLFKEIVAPTTLATGLLFYFGWSHAYWFFDYFGVNSTVLGLTASDYLMRGLDGLFVPLVAVAVLGLVAVWARGCWQAGSTGARCLRGCRWRSAARGWRCAPTGCPGSSWSRRSIGRWRSRR